VPLSRVSSLKRQPSESWGGLVKEAALTSKMKILSVLEYRKKIILRKAGKQSITEKVLSFVQSWIDITELEKTNVIRSLRAIIRSKGIFYIAKSLNINS
jgi:hypothetical protein